ncbi:MAG TPA: hypothetical protein VGO93_21060 [Candidatus Xenobia bacterium]|jgi:hypothetical protein
MKLALIAALTFLLTATGAFAQTSTTTLSSGLIFNLTVTTGPITAGHPVVVTMRGQPGGIATFDVGSHMGLPMEEGPRGVYQGSYMVNVNDNMPQAPVAARLVVDGGSASITSNQPVALVGNGLFSPLISNVSCNCGSTMHPGDSMTITMVGMADGVGSFDVGRHKGIPMTEYSPGNYVGHFTCAAGDVEPNARVVAHLNMPMGEASSMVATPHLAILP